jgi:hypothetical protein
VVLLYVLMQGKPLSGICILAQCMYDRASLVHMPGA